MGNRSWCLWQKGRDQITVDTRTPHPKTRRLRAGSRRKLLSKPSETCLDPRWGPLCGRAQYLLHLTRAGRSGQENSSWAECDASLCLLPTMAPAFCRASELEAGRPFERQPHGAFTYTHTHTPRTPTQTATAAMATPTVTRRRRRRTSSSSGSSGCCATSRRRAARSASTCPTTAGSCSRSPGSRRRSLRRRTTW